MLNRVITWGTLVVLTFLLFGCTTTEDYIDNHISSEFVLIQKPIVVSESDQMQILKLTQLINSPNITNIERSYFLYNRAVVYDRIGMGLLSMLSLMSAIQENTQNADAFSYLGMFYASEGKYLDAYDAFDAALELSPTLYGTYFNRGISLYYGSRIMSAHDDFLKYYDYDTQDPYRIIWLYWVESSMDNVQAKVNLMQRYKAILNKNEIWLNSLIDVILGNKTEDVFWKNLLLNVPTEKVPEVLCEAYFYLGKYHKVMGQNIMADDYFKLSLMTNVTYFIEYRFALRELQHENNVSVEEIISDENVQDQ